MADETRTMTEDRDESTGVAAVAALAALCGVTIALAIVLFALVGWHFPL